MATVAGGTDEPATMLSQALYDLVVPGQPEADVAGALASLPAAIGNEHFWASIAILAGFLPAETEGGTKVTKRAESVVSAAIQNQDALRACPHCAVLWGFGRYHGAFAPAPSDSIVGAVAESHGMSEPLAAYALAAQEGSSLGRLAWGRTRAGGVATNHHQANSFQDGNATWAHLPSSFRRDHDGELGGCLEALETVMAVASTAVAHEHTHVPQPVDLDYVTRTRKDDRKNYALATQLAADGHAEGMAAKAEMLFYGKEKVVPNIPNVANGSESQGSLAGLSAVPMMLLFAACVAPRMVRFIVAALRRCCRVCKTFVGRSTNVQVASRNGDATIIDASGRWQVIVTFFFRAAALAIACFAWWLSSGANAPLGSLPKNETVALDLFAEAATAGHWGAAYALAMLKLDSANRTEATEWLQQVVEHGDGAARAMCRHFQHRFGLGERKNAATAGKFLQEAADLGETNAQLLLAEAYAHDPERLTSEAAEEVEPPGGRNLSNALRYYRKAASAGRLTCRYNIGVILVQNSGKNPREMPLNVCREAYAEFVAVATDLDPTVRLLFALAVHIWELGNYDEFALTLFMILSEIGSEKAHRNAAQLWEDISTRSRRSTGNMNRNVDSRELQDEDREAQRSNATPASSLASERVGDVSDTSAACSDEQSRTGDTFHLEHEGRFCCPGNNCSAPGWLVNEGGLELEECITLCRAHQPCRFMTFYSTSGFCQLSHECGASHPAGDLSARTFALYRSVANCTAAHPSSQPRTATAEPAMRDSSPSIGSWCWPDSNTSSSLATARRCAAAFHLRATDFRGQPDAPHGSALGAGSKAVEAATIAAARHLQWLELHAQAKAWSCWAAEKFLSEQALLQCAALEVEAWDEHPRNLTAASVELQSVADNGSFSAGVTAYNTLLWSYLAFLRAVIVTCHIQYNGVACSELEAVGAVWGVDISLFSSLERALTTVAALSLGCSVALCGILMRTIRRCL